MKPSHTKQDSQVMMRTTRPVLPPIPPTFQTHRLLLRPFSATDLRDYMILRRQPEVMKWTSTSRCDKTVRQTEDFMARFLPSEGINTCGFSVEELERPGVVIGSAGISMLPGKQPELGYMFRKEVWGKGYGTEAVRGILGVYWGLERREVEAQRRGEMEDVHEREFDEMNSALLGQDKDGTCKFQIETLLATTEAANKGSRNVLEKVGFVLAREYSDLKAGGCQCVDYILKRPGR